MASRGATHSFVDVVALVVVERVADRVAGAVSLSSDALTPNWVIAFFDVSFMLMTLACILIKVLTEGLWAFMMHPWDVLDLVCHHGYEDASTIQIYDWLMLLGGSL